MNAGAGITQRCSATTPLSLIKQLHIRIVAKAAVTLLSGHFTEDSLLDEFLRELICGGEGWTSELADVLYGKDRAFEEAFQDSVAVGCGAAEMSSDDVAMLFTQGEDTARSVGCLRAHLGHAPHEERQPGFPLAPVADVL